MDRINKSTTKFVPKRRAPPASSSFSAGASHRASSATPSTSSGTPRVGAVSVAAGTLPGLDEEELDLSHGGGRGAAGGSKGAVETFAVPALPSGVTKVSVSAKAPSIVHPNFSPPRPTNLSPNNNNKKNNNNENNSSIIQPRDPSLSPIRPTIPILPSSSFAPKDPSSSFSSTSSFNSTFQPRDPSIFSSQPSSSFSSTPASSFQPSKGTPFGPSSFGPTRPRGPSPPLLPIPSTSTPAASVTQEQIKARILAGEQLAASKKAAILAKKEGVARKKEEKAQEKVEREARKAEALMSKAKGKGKERESAEENEEGMEGLEAEEEQVLPLKRKRATRLGQAVKPPASGLVDEETGETRLQNDEGHEGIAEEVGEEGEATAPPKKKRVPRKAKTGVTLAEPALDSDGEVISLPDAPRKKRAYNRKVLVEGEEPPVKKPRKSKKLASKMDRLRAENDSDGSDEEGITAPITKKRVPKAKKDAKGKGKGKEKAEVVGEEVPEAQESEEDEYGSDISENTKADMRQAKKEVADRAAVVLANRGRFEVDPATTTMYELATAGDNLAGRSTKKGFELQAKMDKATVVRRAAMKEKTRKMRARAERRRNGESTEPEDAEEVVVKEGEGTPSAVARAGSQTPNYRGASAGVFGAAEVEEEEEQIAEAVEKGSGDEEEEVDDDNFEGLVESQYVPQTRIVDGQLVLDDATLEVDRSLDAKLGHVGPREVVYEVLGDRMINSASWRKKKRTSAWNAQETDYFYECIRQFGTDFEMIAALFPGRERNEIKRKFNKEDKSGHQQKLTDAIMQRKAIDLELYARVTGNPIDLTGPVPEDPLEVIQKRREATEKLEGPDPNAHPFAHLKNKKKGKKNQAVAAVMEEEEEEVDEDAVYEAAEEEKRRLAAIDAALEIELAEEDLQRGANKKRK